MKIWLITDTHFFHTNLVKYGHRPKGFQEKIIRNWKRLVGEEDTVIHLGDVFFSRKSEMKIFLDELPGRKILIRGNHDSDSCSSYMRNGFAFCCDTLEMKRVLLSHWPQPVLTDGAVVNVHGHTHARYGKDYQAFPHCRLLALEYTDYCPVEFEKFCGPLRNKYDIGA